MSDEKKNDEKKIIVDEDWKAKAQKEKEELKAKESQEPKETEKGEEQQGRPPLPEANFSGMVSMLATQAFFAMGLIATEENQEVKADLEMAKFNIDMIAVLEEKTKGNLEEAEAKMLTDTLQQLRMVYVQISSGQK